MEDTLAAFEFLNEYLGLPVPQPPPEKSEAKPIVLRMVGSTVPPLAKAASDPSIFLKPRAFLWSYYGIFDGHGGFSAAFYTQVPILPLHPMRKSS